MYKYKTQLALASLKRMPVLTKMNRHNCMSGQADSPTHNKNTGAHGRRIILEDFAPHHAGCPCLVLQTQLRWSGSGQTANKEQPMDKGAFRLPNVCKCGHRLVDHVSREILT